MKAENMVALLLWTLFKGTEKKTGTNFLHFSILVTQSLTKLCKLIYGYKQNQMFSL